MSKSTIGGLLEWVIDNAPPDVIDRFNPHRLHNQLDIIVSELRVAEQAHWDEAGRPEEQDRRSRAIDSLLEWHRRSDDLVGPGIELCDAIDELQPLNPSPDVAQVAARVRLMDKIAAFRLAVRGSKQ